MIGFLTAVLLVLNFSSIFNNQPSRDIFFGTKGSYRKLSDIPGKVPQDIEIPHGFQVEMVYLLSRHGARYPGSSSVRHIQQIKDVLSKVKHPLSAKLDVGKFVKNGVYSELANVGSVDQFLFGKKIGKLLGNYLNNSTVFNKHKLSDHLHFTSTCVRRCMQSMDAFKQGFFSNLLGRNIVPNGNCKDGEQLRFFDYCKAYKSHKNSVVQLQNQLDRSEPIRQLVHRMNSKLNSQLSSKSLQLSMQNIGTLYDICRFQVLIFDKTIESSPFCKLFTHEDLRLMEFYYDSISDHRLGHTFKSNSMMALPLFKHIFRHLDEVANKKNVNFKVFAEFAHVETTLPLIGLLNAIPLYINQLNGNGDHYVDLPMNANSIEKSLNHQYVRRYGKIAPMNSNVIFMLSKNKKTQQKYVTLYINERLTPMECCSPKRTASYDNFSGNGCTWDSFKSCFQKLASDNHIFNDFCNKHMN